MGRKTNHRNDNKQASQSLPAPPPSNVVPVKQLQQAVRSCGSAPVHIWSTTAGNESLVCAAHFFLPLGCTDKRCKRDHSMKPLHETVAPGSALPFKDASKSHKKKALPPLSIQSHAVLTDVDEISSWKAPSSTIKYIVADGALLYSQELGLSPSPSFQQPSKAKANPTGGEPSTATTTTSTTSTTSSTPLFSTLPESVLLHLFLTFLSPGCYGMVAICSKTMFDLMLSRDNVSHILRHFKLGIPPDPRAALKKIQSHFVHWRNFNVLCDILNTQASVFSSRKSGGPVADWTVLSSTAGERDVPLCLSLDKPNNRFLNVFKLDKTGSLSPYKTNIQMLPTKKNFSIHKMCVSDHTTLVLVGYTDSFPTSCIIYKSQDLIQGSGYVEGETIMFDIPKSLWDVERERELGWEDPGSQELLLHPEWYLHPTEDMLFVRVASAFLDYDVERLGELYKYKRTTSRSS